MRNSFSGVAVGDQKNDWYLPDYYPVNVLPSTVVTSDGTSIYYDRSPISRTECKIKDSGTNEFIFPSPDIASTKYFSNDGILNTTIWLDYPLQDVNESSGNNELPLSFAGFGNISQMVLGVDIIRTETNTLSQAVSDHINRTKANISGFYQYVNESHPLTLKGDRAFKVVYGFPGIPTDPCVMCKEMDLLTLKNDTLFILSYFGDVEKYSKFLPEVQRIINTIQLIRPNRTFTNDETPEISWYENSTYRIKMNYPSHWQKNETNTRLSPFNDIVTFFTPYDNHSKPEGYVDVLIDKSPRQRLGEGLNLHNYLLDVVKGTQMAFTDFKLIEKNDKVLVSGEPAFKLTYTYKDNGLLRKSTDYGIMIGDDKVYILTYDVNLSDYGTFWREAKEIIDSLVINVSNTTYKNDFLVMNYPYNWAKVEGGGLTGYDKSETKSSVSFYSPVEGPYYILKAYRLDIDYDYPYKTQESGFPYTLEHSFSRDTAQSGWTESISDWSLDGDIRRFLYNKTLGRESVEEKGYVNLSLDMDSLNLPDQIYFSISVEDMFLMNGKLCRLIDDGDILASPPPDYSMYFSPNSLQELRRGNDANVVVGLKSNISLPFDVSFSTTHNPLEVTITPNKTAGVQHGVTTSTLNIKVPRNLTEDKSYTIPVRADIQFRPTFNPGNKSFANLTEVSQYSINVIPDLSWGQQITEAWNGFGTAVNGFVGLMAASVGVAGVIGGWFIRKKKRENEALTKLVKLKEKGVLSEAEFARIKKSLLEGES